MDKKEFKETFKELCQSKEISISIEWQNDGYQYFVLKIDNEIIFEEQIKK